MGAVNGTVFSTQSDYTEADFTIQSGTKVVNYTITGLSSGAHTITIEVTGTKGGAAQSTWVWVDAFDYLP